MPHTLDLDTPDADDAFSDPDTNIDLSDLEDDLAEQAKPQAAQALPQAKGDDSLDDLLSESLQIADDIKEAKAARGRLKTGAGGKLQAAADRALVDAFVSAYEWTPVATAGTFTRFTCSHCKATALIFDCLLERQVHKRQATSKRWTQVERANPALPQETIIREREVLACGNCAEAGGWAMVNPTIWKG